MKYFFNFFLSYIIFNGNQVIRSWLYSRYHRVNHMCVYNNIINITLLRIMYWMIKIISIFNGGFIRFDTSRIDYLRPRRVVHIYIYVLLSICSVNNHPTDFRLYTCPSSENENRWMLFVN